MLIRNKPPMPACFVKVLILFMHVLDTVQAGNIFQKLNVVDIAHGIDRRQSALGFLAAGVPTRCISSGGIASHAKAIYGGSFMLNSKGRALQFEGRSKGSNGVVQLTMAANRKDYYSILGIDRKADDKEIKRAYKRLAMRNHPDVNKDPGAKVCHVDLDRTNSPLKIMSGVAGQICSHQRGIFCSLRSRPAPKV
jgi:hypothetical protein